MYINGAVSVNRILTISGSVRPQEVLPNNPTDNP